MMPRHSGISRMIFRMQSQFAHAGVTAEPTISKRKQFKSITPDSKIIAHLDSLELGYIPKKRAREALAKKLGVRANSVGRHSGRPRPIDFEGAPAPFQHPALPVSVVKSAAHLPDFPDDPPEIALIGRSNVGKSTLLNALVGFDTSFVQKAAVSPKPGQTQALHFFALGTGKKKLSNGEIPKCSMVVVDFPGYGFAFMSEEDSKRCSELCSTYLLGNRKNLKRVLLLVDARHGLKINDKEYFRELIYGPALTGDSTENDTTTKPAPSMKQIRAGIHWKLQIVLTKCDLLERDDIARRMAILHIEISDALPGFSNMLPIMTVSGLERKGILELQKELVALIPVDKSPSHSSAPVELLTSTGPFPKSEPVFSTPRRSPTGKSVTTDRPATPRSSSSSATKDEERRMQRRFTPKSGDDRGSGSPSVRSRAGTAGGQRRSIHKDRKVV